MGGRTVCRDAPLSVAGEVGRAAADACRASPVLVEEPRPATRRNPCPPPRPAAAGARRPPAVQVGRRRPAPLVCALDGGRAAQRAGPPAGAPKSVSPAATSLSTIAARCVKERDNTLNFAIVRVFRYFGRVGPCGRGELFSAAAARRGREAGRPPRDPGRRSSQEAAGPVGSVAAAWLVAAPTARATAAFFRNGRPLRAPRRRGRQARAGRPRRRRPPREAIAPTPKPATPGEGRVSRDAARLAILAG
jgi:hypothetical protein